MLGRFHEAIGEFIPEGKKIADFKPDGIHLWRGREWLLSVLDKYLDRVRREKIGNAQVRFVISNIDEIRDGLIENGRHYEQTSSLLPRRIIHSDYAPHNLIFDSNGIKSILDFGWSYLNLRIADIARTLTSFAMSTVHKINSRLTGYFLKAYNNRQPLLDIEMSAIPDIMLWSNLRGIVWILFDELEDFSCLKAKRTPVRNLKKIQFCWERVLCLKTQANEIKQKLYSSLP